MPNETTHESISPVVAALWQGQFSASAFAASCPVVPVAAQKVMSDSLQLVKQFREQRKLYDANRKLSEYVVNELARVGYWGLLVPTQFGGCECPFPVFAKFLTQMATLDPTIAGIAGVHSCIGPVNQLVHFGTSEQKSRILPQLARGERIGVFGLTEPNAGSDLTALRTTATRDGDQFVIHGEKLFITNLTVGRTMGLVCLIDNQPSVAVVELPDHETPEFQLNHYGLHSLQHTSNCGITFRGLRVPVENRLIPSRGDGLAIAYHGLNRGRITLCANAAGTMRVLLANMLPWVHYRKTYGSEIGNRQLVLRRIGRCAALIFACESLAAWGATLIASGQRGEIEAIIAKTFAADALREAAIELFMKTHGGRAFLYGHLFGDHVHDYLAPSIYEGENEILYLALFKALIKPHLNHLHEPFDATIQHLDGFCSTAPAEILPRIGEIAKSLRETAHAMHQLILKHGTNTANEQIIIRDLAKQAAHDVMLLVVARAIQPDRADQVLAFQVLDNAPHHQKSSGEISTADHAAVKLGEMIVDGAWPDLAEIPTQPILQPYERG